LISLLWNKISLWGLNLVTRFLNALSPDLQEVLQADSTCSTPDLSALMLFLSARCPLFSLRCCCLPVCSDPCYHLQNRTTGNHPLSLLWQPHSPLRFLALPLLFRFDLPMTSLLKPALSCHKLSRPSAAVNQIPSWPLAVALLTLSPTVKVPAGWFPRVHVLWRH
jgi:hypothetical protein